MSGPLDEASEMELLRSGDERAWHAFWEREALALTAQALRILRRRGARWADRSAEVQAAVTDAVSATYLKIVEGRVSRAAGRYAGGVLRRSLLRGGARRTQLQPDDMARGSRAPDEKVAAREATEVLRRRTKVAIVRLHDEILDEARQQTVPYSFRRSPFLHLAVLDLEAHGMGAQAISGPLLGKEDRPQLTKLREAAIDRACAALSRHTGGLVDREFFRQDEFGAWWDELDAGCLDTRELESISAGSPHFEDLRRQQRIHLDVVGCEICRAIRAPDGELQAAALELTNWGRVAATQSIAARG